MEVKEAADLPVRTISIDRLVAINIRYWRRIAGLTQGQLGAVTGLTAPNISAIERSAEPDRERRRFDAQSLADFAAVLGVPLLALLLPPPDDGGDVRYMVEASGGEEMSMKDLLTLILPDTGEDSPVMDTYRQRLRSVVATYMAPDWVEDVNYWLRDLTTAEQRAERAAALLEGGAALERIAAELRRLAADLTAPEEQ